MTTNEEKIQKVLACMTENEKKLWKEAIAQGYKDEVCSECGTVILAFHHFLRCKSETCPMKEKDSSGKTHSLLEKLIGGVTENPQH